ncbi:hypothetical protein AKO1_005297 [Acrasis kona]|uniref:BTB domain-containing protein n=1 Tax=Acrasis kona TaxID=1008807 RepID=A0AAW2YJN9_9EUKA
MFNGKFMEAQNTKQIIEEDDFRYNIILCMLNYMYNNILDVDLIHFVDVLKIAKKYDVEKLIEECHHLLPELVRDKGATSEVYTILIQNSESEVADIILNAASHQLLYYLLTPDFEKISFCFIFDLVKCYLESFMDENPLGCEQYSFRDPSVLEDVVAVYELLCEWVDSVELECALGDRLFTLFEPLLPDLLMYHISCSECDDQSIYFVGATSLYHHLKCKFSFQDINQTLKDLIGHQHLYQYGALFVKRSYK